ncbi:DUF4453 domain-containing protein [Yoonia sp. SS1-5]|uniref:DUF4453 domain-containing protein n=1 Tax=Yoonia rhodophyticola TaxID=3137370 RepID=A0AAN0NK32_9RHOB
MRFICLCLTFLIAAPAAQASDDFCHELWYTRNLIVDRTGYCFGSELGQSVFDNTGCTTGSPALSSADARKVARIRDVEDEMMCSVNTGSTRLNFSATAELQRLLDLPVPDRIEGGCVGWQGGARALRAGHDADAAQIGTLNDGDSVSFAHEPEGDWSYVTIYDGPDDGQAGWVMLAPISEDSCAQWVG